MAVKESGHVSDKLATFFQTIILGRRSQSFEKRAVERKWR